MRIFEGMGCGALVITELTPYQSRIFKVGEHYVVFKNHKDLLENHTYEHRGYELLNVIDKLRGA